MARVTSQASRKAKNQAVWRKRHPVINARRVSAWRKKNPHKVLLASVRGNAKHTGREFSITMDDLRPFPTHCPVFGMKLQYGGAKSGTASLASVDRINNSKGYVPGNVIIVSWRANNLKRDATVEELEKLVRFYRRLKRRV